MANDKSDGHLTIWYAVAWILTILLVLIAITVLYENHMILDMLKDLLDHIHKAHL